MLCCYNSYTTLNPHRLKSVSGFNTNSTLFMSSIPWRLCLLHGIFRGHAGIAWQQPQPVPMQSVGVYPPKPTTLDKMEQQTQDTFVNVPSRLLKEKCWVCIFRVLEMCTKQWDLYCNLTLNSSEQASKECKNCSNKALRLKDTAALPYLSTFTVTSYIQIVLGVHLSAKANHYILC
jgi:hypothetical protein